VGHYCRANIYIPSIDRSIAGPWYHQCHLLLSTCSGRNRFRSHSVPLSRCSHFLSQHGEKESLVRFCVPQLYRDMSLREHPDRAIVELSVSFYHYSPSVHDYCNDPLRPLPSQWLVVLPTASTFPRAIDLVTSVTS
jgi:hypothetical protein